MQRNVLYAFFNTPFWYYCCVRLIICFLRPYEVTRKATTLPGSPELGRKGKKFRFLLLVQGLCALGFRVLGYEGSRVRFPGLSSFLVALGYRHAAAGSSSRCFDVLFAESFRRNLL